MIKQSFQIRRGLSHSANSNEGAGDSPLHFDMPDLCPASAFLGRDRLRMLRLDLMKQLRILDQSQRRQRERFRGQRHEAQPVFRAGGGLEALAVRGQPLRADRQGGLDGGHHLADVAHVRGS